MSVYFGKIKFYNLKSKFGFINQTNTRNDYYFNLKDPIWELQTNDFVSFELKESKRGLVAFNLKKIDNKL
jgi:cold shock CspA family protein